MDLDVMRLRKTVVGLLQRIDALEERVGQCERVSGIQPAAAPSGVTPPPLPASYITIDPPAVDSAMQQADPVGREEVRPTTLPSLPSQWSADAPPAAQPSTSPESRGVSITSNNNNANERASANSLELMIGGRWYALVGAIFVVIGLGLFLKFGIENGWFAMPPAMRCLMVGLGGLGLLGAGEYVRRRISRIGAAGLYSAGLATLYLTVYGAHALYDLIPPNVSFTMMAATAIAGIALACFTALPAVAVISILGGYVVPLMFADSGAHAAVLPSYLVMLLLIAMVPTAVIGPSFALSRTVGRIGVLVLGTLGALTAMREAPAVYITFALTVWAIIHGELVWSALRGKLEQASEPSDEAAILILRDETLSHAHAALMRTGPIAAMFSAGAWTVGVCVLGVRFMEWGGGLAQHMGAAGWEFILSTDAMSRAEGIVPAVLMLVCLGLSALLTPPGQLIRVTPTQPRDRLAAALAVQAGCLLFVLIALTLGGYAQILAWIGAGVAACIAGYWLRTGVFFVYGGAALAIAAVRLYTPGALDGIFSGSLLELGYVTLTSRGILSLACAAATAVGAVLLHRVITITKHSTPLRERGADLLTVLASLLVGGSLISEAYTAGQVGMALSIAGLLLAFTSLRRASLRVIVPPLLLCAASCVFLTAWWTSPRTVAFLWSTFAFDGLTLLLCASAWCTLALRATLSAAVPGGATKAESGVFAGYAAAIMFAAATVHNETPLIISATLWLCYAWAWVMTYVILGGSLRRDAQPRVLAVSALLQGACGLAVASALVWIGQDLDNPTGVSFLRGLALAAFALAGTRALAACYPQARTELIGTGRAAGCTLLLIATSVQVAELARAFAGDRSVRAAAVSMWWGAFSVGLIGLGLWRQSHVLRYAGLVLLAVAGVKGFIFDIATAPLGWRIVSFILLGLLMIGVGVAYQKFLAPRADRLRAGENA
jgi:uncharacterized membrane protein